VKNDEDEGGRKRSDRIESKKEEGPKESVGSRTSAPCGETRREKRRIARKEGKKRGRAGEIALVMPICHKPSLRKIKAKKGSRSRDNGLL